MTQLLFVRYPKSVSTHMGLRAGVDKLDSDDLCCNSDLNFAILDAKSAVSSYSGSGLSVTDGSDCSVDIEGICNSLFPLSSKFPDFSWKKCTVLIYL